MKWKVQNSFRSINSYVLQFNYVRYRKWYYVLKILRSYLSINLISENSVQIILSTFSSILISKLNSLIVSLNKEVKVESSAFPLNRRCQSSKHESFANESIVQMSIATMMVKLQLLEKILPKRLTRDKIDTLDNQVVVKETVSWIDGLANDSNCLMEKL